MGGGATFFCLCRERILKKNKKQKQRNIQKSIKIFKKSCFFSGKNAPPSQLCCDVSFNSLHFYGGFFPAFFHIRYAIICYFERKLRFRYIFVCSLLGNAQKLSKSAKINIFQILEISAWHRFFGLIIGYPM